MASPLAAQMMRKQTGILPDGRAHPDVTAQIAATRGHGEPLPPAVREPMAAALGDGFSDVRVHTDALAASLARSVQARAFTTGADIYFGAGEFQPASSQGREMLAHELAHVVQQRGMPTSGPLTVSDPGDALEVQAEQVARSVSTRPSLSRVAAGQIQRLAEVDDDAKKLDFMISRFGAQAKKVFVNAKEDQIDASVRLLDEAWRKLYEPTSKLTLATAKTKPPAGELLKALGKTGTELNSPTAYQLLAGVMTATFDDDADHEYNYKPSVEAKVSLGTEWALEIIKNDAGAIEPEDKSLDHRVKSCTYENIVVTGADTGGTATALYTVQLTKPHKEVKPDGAPWELHAHVTKDGEVRFAHTKSNGKHYSVVNSWFEDNIPEEDRTWS